MRLPWHFKLRGCVVWRWLTGKWFYRSVIWIKFSEVTSIVILTAQADALNHGAPLVVVAFALVALFCAVSL